MKNFTFIDLTDHKGLLRFVQSVIRFTSLHLWVILDKWFSFF